MSPALKATVISCYLGIALLWTLIDWGEFFQRPTWKDFGRIILAMALWPLSMFQEFYWRPRKRRRRDQDRDCG